MPPSSPSDFNAQLKKTKRLRGVPSRQVGQPRPVTPTSAPASLQERHASPGQLSITLSGEQALVASSPPMDNDLSSEAARMPYFEPSLIAVDDDTVEHSSEPLETHRRRTDSSGFRYPALTAAISSPSPIPPEWTPSWPDRPSESRIMEGPQIYSMYGTTDPPLGSDVNAIHATIGELAAPRRITAVDALGSIVAGKHQNPPERPIPMSPGRHQSGVYVHSLPSASEPEVPSSSSDSDDGGRFLLEPPGHTSSPVFARHHNTSAVKGNGAIEAISHRMHRGISQSSRALHDPGIPRPVDHAESSTAATTVGSDVVIGGADTMSWTQWDTLNDRRLLIVGYAGGGVQMWDVTDLDVVHEVLHLTGVFPRSVTRTARVLPRPPPSPVDDCVDTFSQVRPLLAVLLGTAELILYSLATHNVIKRMFVSPSLEGVTDCDMQTSETFVVVSTVTETHDTALHVLSAYDMKVLHVFSLLPSSILPAFSLSRRIIAVASQAPSTSSHSTRPPTLQDGITMLKDGANRANSLKMEVATTARGVWNGMSSAASNAWGGLLSGSLNPTAASSSRWSFSRSAPTPGSVEAGPIGEWGTSPTTGSPSRAMAPGQLQPPSESGAAQQIGPESGSAKWISVYDLHALLGHSSARAPFPVAHFPLMLASKSSSPSSSSSSVAALSISPSGALLAVSDKDGALVKVFHVRGNGVMRGRRPAPPPASPRPPRAPSLSSSPSDVYPIPSSSHARSRRRGSATSPSRPIIGINAPMQGSRSDYSAPERFPNVWHVYDLVRGVTRAKVESIVWAHDERWIGVGTAAGTLHVFATNPYGGPPDEDSHLEGRVRNISEFQPLSVALQPLARIHSHANRVPAPLVTGFQPSSTRTLNFVLPPNASALRSSTFSPRAPSSPITSTPTPSFTEPAARRPSSGFQDVLMTIPALGRLELHRNTVFPTTRVPDSLPAAMSTSPPRASPTHPSISLPSSGLTHMMRVVRGETKTGLRAQQTPVATWDIRKDHEWEDVKGGFAHAPSYSRNTYDHDWLSEAELSTGTASQSMLPKSIYLSHQFSFYSLAEDWQAPLIQSVFELPCTKLEVRKEVEISPFPSASISRRRHRTGDADSFVQGNAYVGSPFDEPLASAIHARIDATPPAPAVIPSYPNGFHVSPHSWMDATAPLKHAAVGLSDGVGEGIGRLRREIGKVAKSPRNEAVRRANILSFDEHTVFAEGDDGPFHTTESSGGSEATASTSNLDTPDNWDEWKEGEVADEVAEYEAFESLGLGIVGEMDEDQHIRRPPADAVRTPTSMMLSPTSSTIRRRRGA